MRGPALCHPENLVGQDILSVAVVFACGVLLGILQQAGREVSSLQIPAGKSVQIEGPFNPAEWRDSATASVRVDPSWTVRILVKHDAANLYLAFERLERGGRRLYPEVMIDPELKGGSRWSHEQFWFHISNNLCEGQGVFSVYEQNGVFQCGHTKAGWAGTNPPQGREPVRVRISFEKIGLDQPRGKKIGLALDVTDASGEANQLFRYWPRNADIRHPSSWGIAEIN